MKTSLLSLCTLAVLSAGCLEIKVSNPLKKRIKVHETNAVTTEDLTVVNKTVTDPSNNKIKLQFVSPELLSSKTILSVSSPETQKVLKTLVQGEKAAASISTSDAITGENSLILGFPIGLVGEYSIFGGVITKVSDKDNETLGGLKLTDLPALTVRTVIAPGADGNPTVTLLGCPGECDEESDQLPLVSFPIVGLNQEQGLLMLDLAPIGKELDLVMMLDPKGQYTKLKTRSSSTVGFDYSVSTLVFDIKSSMIPVTADVNDETAPVTEFTVRWYLKLNSAFNPSFTSRTPTPEVGFFQTERSKSPKITRFSTTNNGYAVKYYIKNVPAEFRKIFAGAFDNWNVEFKKILGRDLLEYEFIEKEDPRNNEIVAGDIRFNVLEWDLYNRAGYGGLGPSIANQMSGETLSANVLIQGPHIIKMYTKWFGVSEKVRELRNNGFAREANELLKSFNVKVAADTKELTSTRFALKLGKHLIMNVNSQRPELQDPAYKGHFEVVPAGVTFESYMTGYFTEMLEHELGHNLGLRHNFKGNLGAYETGAKGSVSRSIMEYLGRPYRHLNAIGLYDKMAIAYGYKGQAPKHANWFCTDEDQGSTNTSLMVKSPECTKSDATSDPYSFWEGRLDRAIDLLLDTKTAAAPVWKLAELTELQDAIMGLAAYALSAEKTFSTWTNFFGKGERPENPEDVKAYVLASFKSKLCDPKLALVINGKENEEAKKAASDNLAELQKTVAEKTAGWNLFKVEELSCN